MNSSNLAPNVRSPATVATLIKRLRRSARLLKTGALLTLFAIVAIVVGGTWLFIEVGGIAASELDFSTRVTGISIEQMKDVTDGIFRRTEDDAVDRLIKAKASDPESRKIIDDFKAEVEAGQKLAAGVGERIKEQLSRAASPSDAKVWQATISSSVARLSAVGLLLFLVQLFVTLYRYNYRLGAYYSARADALELLPDGSLEELHHLTALLSPDALDFGELPKPSDQVMQLVREAVGSARNIAKP
jgi:hypothetical protein